MQLTQTIDKLYISTYPFKLVAKDKLTGEIVEKQQRGVEYDFEIQKEFEQGTEDYYKAGLVNAYLQLLKDGGKYDETKPEGEQFEVGTTIQVNQRSIDNDTELIDGVLEELESNRVVPTYKPFKYDSLHTQVNTKQSFMVGKVGIGPFALNNNSLILTTIYEVEFKHDDFSVMTALNLNSLHNKKDQDGKSILSWLSALINVHVDVAKDPKIARLNVNKYTYNLTNVLIRTGLGKRTFYFLKQPIVELMAQEFDAAGGELTLSSESPSKRLEDAVNALVLAGSGNLKFNDTLCNLIKDYSECRNNIDWREIKSGRYSQKTAEAVEKLTFIQRVAADLFDQKNNILKDIITNPNALKDPSSGVSIDNLKDDKSFTYDVAGQKMTPLEVQAYVVVIKNQFDVYSRMMADLVAVTKIDTKKEGKTYSEQKEYMDRYDKFLRDGLKHFTESIYDMMGVTVREVDEKSHEVTKLEDDPYISFINHKTERATNALLRLLESQILPASGKFDTVRARIINKTRGYGQEFKQKVDLAIVSFIKAKYFQEYIKQNNINARSLFVTEYSEDGSTVVSKNISDRVNELVYKIENDTTGKYSKYQRNGQVSNALLKMLVTDLYDHKDGIDNPEFMLLSTEDAEDSFSSNDVINGWQQMLESDDEEIKKLAEDLIIYSFLTSGGQSGRSKFFNYVPLSWLTQKHNVFDGMSFAEYMEAALNDANSQDTQAPFFDITDDDIDDIITNNWMDNDFCPVITDQQTLTGVRLNIPSSKFKEPFGVFAPVEERQEADGRKRSILNKVITSYGGQEFPSVVKICTNGERSSNPHDWLVYKKIGEGLANDGTRYPIYALTYPKGVKTKATNSYQLYEYATDKFGIGMNYYVPLAWYAAATIPDRLERNAKAIADHIAEGGKLETAPMEISNPAYQYIASSFYKANSAKIAAKNNLKQTNQISEAISVAFSRNSQLEQIGTLEEYAQYLKEVYGDGLFYWHGSNSDLSNGPLLNKETGSGAPETGSEMYFNLQPYASLQYVNGVNTSIPSTDGFNIWTKLWWLMKEIMGNGRYENDEWQNLIVNELNVRQNTPNKRGVFDRDSGGTHGKYLSERKAQYGYENKTDKEFFEEVFDLRYGKESVKDWVDRKREEFKKIWSSGRKDGIYPVYIRTNSGIATENGMDTYYGERGVFDSMSNNNQGILLSNNARNELRSNVAVVVNPRRDVVWMGSSQDVEAFRKWKSSGGTENNNPAEYTNHSGGAYGGDTMWDQVGRRYGVTKHNHYRDEGNTSLSKTLRDAGVKATVLTHEQMEFARQKVKELLGKEYPNTTEGNLLVRNFYQVYNADAVFAIGTIASNSSVSGGTNTAVQLGIKLLKPTYVFNLKDNQWYLYSELEGFVQTETPTLTKNFAGVGTRDIQLYKKRDADGNWVDNPKYLGDAAKQAAYNAVKAVYEKTFGKQGESLTLQPTVQQTIDVKFGNEDLWSALSNFAERKFTLDVSIGGLKQPITFSSVEGAFQAMKLFYSPIGLTKETVAQFQGLAAYSAQRAGSAIHGLDIARWDRNKEAILKKIMLESFKQNAAAAELLLSTGNATITHSVGGDYATLFPKLLMEIRAELQRERDEAVEAGKPIIESANTVLGTEEARLWNENGVSDDNPRILVASEHTDAVLHSHEIVEMLKGNRPIISHRTIDGKFSPNGVEIPVEEFNGLYLMTKHDGLPLRKILEATDKRGRKIPKIIHFSITGYGGTEWEPGVMKPDDMLDRIQALIDEKLLDPKWVTVRIDPIIPGHFDKKMTKHIIDRAKAMGIRRFRISVMDFYDQIGNPQIDPATGKDTRPNVMKNYDWDQYYGRKSNSTIDWMNSKEAERIVNMSRFKLGRLVSMEEVNRWIQEFHESGIINDEAKKMGVKFHPYGEFNKNAKQSYVDEVFGWFDNLAAEDQSISIGSCAEAAVKNYPNITPEGCLSVASVNAMLGTHIQEKGTDNNKQRKECSCFGNKTDMLAYSDACASSCTYCYAKQNTTKPLTYYEADGTLKRNGLTVTSIELLKSDNAELQPQLVLAQTLTFDDNLITVTSTDGRTITYNKEQSDAIRNATDFLLNGNPSEYYVIEGKAGTGKTTIAKEVIRRYKEKNPFDKLLIGALSNKATFVIRNSFKGFDVPGITPDTFKTTAGMLGMKLDQETGQFVQDRSNFKKKFPIQKADLIVIDEASMMNEDNIKMVMSMKKPSAKVLFLGDIGQLPPIRPADSPNQNSKSEVFASSNKSSLVTRVRQGEANPILPFADHFWNNNTSSDNAVLDPVPASAKKNLIKGTSGNLLFADDIENLSQQIVKLFLRGIDMADVNYAKIVVYTNAKRQQLNSYLHKQLFGNTDLNIDEPMIAQSPVMDFDIYEERERTIITTSDEFVITNIGKPEISDYGVETQLITAVLSSEQRSERPSKKIFRVVTRQGMDDYNRVSDMLLAKAKATIRGSRDSAMAWKEFYKFKAIHNTMNYNQRGGSNIDYGYAITSHKSQGSTYTAVIVDADDIMSVSATSSRNKSESIYTALTRPKNTAIYIDPSVDNATRNETCSMDIAKLVKDSTPIQLSEQQQRLAEEDMNNCKGK